MWPGIIIADVDSDGTKEVVTAHSAGRVGIWNIATGTTWRAPWPITLGTNEYRSIAVADLDRDGKLEIAIGKAVSANINVWVLENDGSIRPGWPRGTNTTGDGYTWGVYNNNIGITNMDADANLEVVVPSDVTYTCAYKADGTPLSVPKSVSPANGKDKWGHVQFATERKYEVLGYVDCSGFPADDPSRTNFADGPVVISDLDGDGTEELVFTGRTYKFCGGGAERTTHNGVYVMNKDRSRWVTAKYNWTVVPDNQNHPSLGDPLSMDYNVIESATYNAVVADLDGDGEKEILFSSYDGKIHVFWLDKTEKHNWPYVVGTPGAMKYATEPVVVDFDNDGKAEIVVSVWTAKGTKDWGTLLVLDYQGNVLWSVALPQPKSCDFNPTTCTQTWAGAIASPSVGQLNSDDDLEIALVTTDAGIVAYTVPNSANARVLWGTSRGGLSRIGSVEGPIPSPPPLVPAPVVAPVAPPPVDCVGAWSPWPACDCVSHLQTRTYGITTMQQNGGQRCPANDGQNETQSCTPADCNPVNCVGSWSEWTTCSCTTNTQTRDFTVTVAAANGGAVCAATHGQHDNHDCTPVNCPVDCVGTWSDWTTCNCTASPNYQRTFTVTTPDANGGTPCEAADQAVDVQSCCGSQPMAGWTIAVIVVCAVAGFFGLIAIIAGIYVFTHMEGGGSWEKA